MGQMKPKSPETWMEIVGHFLEEVHISKHNIVLPWEESIYFYTKIMMYTVYLPLLVSEYHCTHILRERSMH